MRSTVMRLSPRYLNADNKTDREKNFGLTAIEFSSLLNELQAGNQRLYEQIFLQHFEDASKYLCRNDGAAASAAYDAVMETMLRFRDLLVAEKIQYGNLRYLFTRMARQEYARSNIKAIRFMDLSPEILEMAEEEVEFTREEYDLLSRAFKNLGTACRELLRAFYFHRQSLKDIADEQDRTGAAVRKQKSRCVATLRRYFYNLSQ